MGEHIIRLRRGWTGRFADGARRVDLPADWSGLDLGSVVLCRRFQRPRFDPCRVSVRIRVRDAPGLRAVRLNGRSLPVGDGSWAVSELLRPAGNLLELEAEPDVAAGLWGDVALVILDRDPADRL